MIPFCTFCVILFFIKGKVKFHEPKGVFVLAAYFYACFGMSGTLDIIKGDTTVPEELINVVLITFIPLIFLGFKKSNYTKPKSKKEWDLRYLKWILYSTIIIGLLGFFYTIQKLGGIDVLVLNPNRVERNQAITESGWNFPYIIFLQLGYTASLLYNYYKKKPISKILINSILLISPLILFNLVEGERSNIFKIILISFFFYITYYSNSFKYSFGKIILITVLFLGFSALGNIRSQIQLAVAQGDFSHISRYFDRSSLADFLIPNEPKAVAFTWRYSHQLMKERKLDYQYGYTYYQSIPYFFPGFIYRTLSIKKNDTISDKLGDWYASEYGIFKRVGFGYLGLGEFYLNFGKFGCFFFFPIFLRLIDFITNKIKSYKTSNEIIYLTVLPLFTYFIHRVSFASVGSALIWFSFVIVFLTLTFSVYKFIRTKNEF